MKKSFEHIVVPIASLKYFKYFSDYFNYVNAEHNHQFTFIVDDRHDTSLDEFLDAFNNSALPIHKVVPVSTILKELQDDLSHCTYLEEILNVYGVSIKLVMFYYILKVLNYEKFFYLDDDVVILRPLVNLFDNHAYAIKTDLALDVISGLVPEIYGQDVWDEFISDTKFRVSSGSILYTPTKEKTEMFLNHITKFFSHKRVIEWYEYKSDETGYIVGKSWGLEQHLMGLFFMLHHKDTELHKIGAEIRIGGSKSELDEELANKGFRRVPSIYHPGCRKSSKKLDFIKRFVERLEATEKRYLTIT